MPSTTSESNVNIQFHPDRNILLRAGAGAGKTTTLIRLFFEVVEYYRQSEKRWPRIVLTTFTRKATQEIRERLMKEALKQKDDGLFQFLQSKYYVQISTIHGVLSLFLSRFGDRIGLPQDFQLVDESIIIKHQKLILRKELEKRPEAIDLLEDYNFLELLKLVKNHVEASSFYQVQRYAKENLEQDFKNEILKIKKMAQEIILQAPQETLNEKWTEFISLISFFNKPIDDFEKIIEDMSLFYETKPSKPTFKAATSPISAVFNDQLVELLKAIENFVEKKLSIYKHRESYEKISVQFEKLATGYKSAWRRLQSEQGLLTMQDLEILCAEILKNDPQAGLEFSKSWDYWMVDEFQDTSPLQDFLIQSLKGVKSEFVVGDPQQSIYLFRGARSEVFSEKQKNIISQNGLVSKQLVNYRSRKEVLEFINSFFAKISTDFESMYVGSEKTEPQIPACIVYAGGVRNEEESSDEQTTESSSWSEDAATSRIQELLLQGVKPEDICVLSRSHKNLKKLTLKLQDCLIPYYHHSTGQFFQKREIKDALQILRFLDNPHDNINFIGLLRSPWFYQTDDEIRKICQGHSYWLNAIKLFPQNTVFVKLAAYLDECHHYGDLMVFKKVLVDIGLIDTCRSIDSSGQREANLWKLIQLCESLQTEGAFSITDFVEKATRSSEDSTGEDRETAAVIEPSRVQLMTIHASKGLQFAHVILAGFGDSPPPKQIDQWNISETRKMWSLTLRDLETGLRLTTPLAHEILEERKRREDEESLRLLYVAMTRAKDSVTLVWDKPKANSWAQIFPFDLSVGAHPQENFIYEVRDQALVQPAHLDKLLSSESIKNVWQDEKEGSNILSRTSVTRLLETSKVESKKENSKSLLRLDFEKSKKGQMAHRLFESLKYNLDFEKIETEDEQFKKALQFVVNLKNPPLSKMLPSAEVEWGFTVDWNGQRLTGQIDLWCVHENELWVLDYKTGSVSSLDKSMKQLAIYAECLFKTKRAHDHIKINLVALYPMDEKVFIKEFSGREKLLQFL